MVAPSGRVRSSKARASRPRDAEDTRGRILQAAAPLFARKGFDGVRLREVAEEAGVTVPLVCHHFRDKESLYSAVIDRAAQRFATVGWDLLRGDGSFMDRVTALIAGMIDWLAVDPVLTVLLHRELVDGGSRARSIAERWLLPLKRAAVNEVRSAQRQGLVRADLDPELLVLHVLGALVYPSVAAPIVRAVWKTDPVSRAMLERRKRELTALLGSLVLPQEKETAPTVLHRNGRGRRSAVH